MTRRREGNPAPAAAPAPQQPQPETNPAHEAIRAHLARIGVVGEDEVASALDAHDAGIDMVSLIQDIKGGIPHWLAVTYALSRHLHGDQPADSGAPGSGQSPGKTGGGAT